MVAMEGERHPLDSLKLPFFNQAKGEVEELPALDPKFCQAVKFSEYQSAPDTSPEMDPSVWGNWIENLNIIEKNLIWLLKLPHPKFWCQVVNNTSLYLCLDSYLKKAPRFQPGCWPDEALERHNSVHKLVFLAYIRMATFKETATDFISRDFFGELIYENFIFDVPKVMDLCAVYGNKTNSSLLEKAIANIFDCQPGYNDDLIQTVDTVIKIFHSIDEKCGVVNESGNDGGDQVQQSRPHRLSESSGNDARLLDMPFPDFKDVILYVSDVTHTLCRFAEVYGTACTTFYKDKSFVTYLARFYSTTLVKLREAIEDRHIHDLHMRSQLLAHLKIARKSLLGLVRSIINACLLQPALNAADAGDVSRVTSNADSYLQVLSELLGEPRFFSDFMRKLPILDDVQSLLKVSPTIDETRASFILGSIGGISDHKPNSRLSPRYVNNLDPPHVPTIPEVGQDEPTVSGAGAASYVPGVKMDSLVSSVRDVLPDLGEGFIESCLMYYDMDCEKTIHALLEENLPDDLRMMDRSTPRTPRVDVPERVSEPAPQDSVQDATSMLKKRMNIFDMDEFDVYANPDVDRSRMHKGKKDKASNDDSLKSQDKQRIYEKYSVICDEEDISDDGGALQASSAAFDNVYDDEYDDMYDALGVDANDADDADDLLNRRPFVTPRVFLQRRKEKVYEESESEESDKEKKDHFIANPAEVRAKQEERRRQQQELRTRKHRKPQTESSGDKSKQEHDRKKKDANKARVANHNRKKMATKKAGRGMGLT